MSWTSCTARGPRGRRKSSNGEKFCGRWGESGWIIVVRSDLISMQTSAGPCTYV
jgi:hypothetical protein